MVDQLERKRPLIPGMKVLDPACGSGAFLVHCYRRLIEKERSRRGRRLNPTELREMLTNQIFGIDVDIDACRVAEFSLLLTLLDYLQPPDLVTMPTFKLPDLAGQNIINADTFCASALSLASIQGQRFDWVIGNPPFKHVNSSNLRSVDRRVYEWMASHKSSEPTGGNQVAEAFAWLGLEMLAPAGVCGFVMPASTFFKYEAEAFRKTFLNRVNLWFVANLSNLAEVLFVRRARVPVACVFFSHAEEEFTPTETFSPLVANQVSQVPSTNRRRRDIWSLTINEAEVKLIPHADINQGDSLPWRLSGWGSKLDQRLLSRVKRFASLQTLEARGVLTLSEGLQTRRHSKAEKLEHHPEIAGWPTLKMKPLANQKHLFSFSDDWIEPLDAEETWVREGRFTLPFRVCRPPHVVVSASRSFAVYVETDLIVPARQIGIGGSSSILQALTIYLNSDFALYHQILNSPQYLIKRPVATLQALRELPVPFDENSDLAAWVQLHREFASALDGQTHLADENIRSINKMVNEWLQLDQRTAMVVSDFVKVRLSLRDGQMGKDAIQAATSEQLKLYAHQLRMELDEFLGDEEGSHHQVRMLHSPYCIMAEITYHPSEIKRSVAEVITLSEDKGHELNEARIEITRQQSQWAYFRRSLRHYVGNKTYLIKPSERIHWLGSQASIDAGEIIAERMGALSN